MGEMGRSIAEQYDLLRKGSRYLLASIEGDMVFPPFDRSQWREVERSAHPADDRHAYAMTFSTLER
jgi:hypothetical protein